MPKYKPVIQTPEQIEEMAKQVVSMGNDIAAAADKMRGAKFDKLPIGGYGQMKSAVKFTNAYFAAVKTAIFDARTERGDFDSGEPKPKKSSVRKPDTNSQK